MLGIFTGKNIIFGNFKKTLCSKSSKCFYFIRTSSNMHLQVTWFTNTSLNNWKQWQLWKIMIFLDLESTFYGYITKKKKILIQNSKYSKMVTFITLFNSYHYQIILSKQKESDYWSTLSRVSLNCILTQKAYGHYKEAKYVFNVEINQFLTRIPKSFKYLVINMVLYHIQALSKK